jgi:hypothetical protein
VNQLLSAPGSPPYNRTAKPSQQPVDGIAKPSEAAREDLYNLFALKSDAHPNSSLQECPHIWVDMNGGKVNLGVDTQASINAMSKETFDRLVNKPKLSPCPIAAYSFDGKTPIKAVGSFKSAVKANGRSVTCEFVVFKGVRGNLLGFESCVQLGLIQLTYALSEGDKPDKDNTTDCPTRNPISWHDDSQANGQTSVAEQMINVVAASSAPTAIRMEELLQKLTDVIRLELNALLPSHQSTQHPLANAAPVDLMLKRSNHLPKHQARCEPAQEIVETQARDAEASWFKRCTPEALFKSPLEVEPELQSNGRSQAPTAQDPEPAIGWERGNFDPQIRVDQGSPQTPNTNSPAPPIAQASSQSTGSYTVVAGRPPQVTSRPPRATCDTASHRNPPSPNHAEPPQQRRTTHATKPVKRFTAKRAARGQGLR